MLIFISLCVAEAKLKNVFCYCSGFLPIERTLAGKKQQNAPSDDDWVDGKTICRYLGISPRTLQRLRSDRVISYSSLNHKLYYTLGDIKRVLHERSVKRCKE